MSEIRPRRSVLTMPGSRMIAEAAVLAAGPISRILKTASRQW